MMGGEGGEGVHSERHDAAIRATFAFVSAGDDGFTVWRFRKISDYQVGNVVSYTPIDVLTAAKAKVVQAVFIRFLKKLRRARGDRVQLQYEEEEAAAAAAPRRKKAHGEAWKVYKLASDEIGSKEWGPLIYQILVFGRERDHAHCLRWVNRAEGVFEADFAALKKMMKVNAKVDESRVHTGSGQRPGTAFSDKAGAATSSASPSGAGAAAPASADAAPASERKDDDGSTFDFVEERANNWTVWKFRHLQEYQRGNMMAPVLKDPRMLEAAALIVIQARLRGFLTRRRAARNAAPGELHTSRPLADRAEEDEAAAVRKLLEEGDTRMEKVPWKVFGEDEGIGSLEWGPTLYQLLVYGKEKRTQAYVQWIDRSEGVFRVNFRVLQDQVEQRTDVDPSDRLYDYEDMRPVGSKRTDRDSTFDFVLDEGEGWTRWRFRHIDSYHQGDMKAPVVTEPHVLDAVHRAVIQAHIRGFIVRMRKKRGVPPHELHTSDPKPPYETTLPADKERQERLRAEAEAKRKARAERQRKADELRAARQSEWTKEFKGDAAFASSAWGPLVFQLLEFGNAGVVRTFLAWVNKAKGHFEVNLTMLLEHVRTPSVESSRDRAEFKRDFEYIQPRAADWDEYRMPDMADYLVGEFRGVRLRTPTSVFEAERAVTIQRHVRGFLARLNRRRVEEGRASTSIQRMVRGKQTRSKFEADRERLERERAEREERRVLENEAATTVQAAVRGHLARTTRSRAATPLMEEKRFREKVAALPPQPKPVLNMAEVKVVSVGAEDEAHAANVAMCKAIVLDILRWHVPGSRKNLYKDILATVQLPKPDVLPMVGNQTYYDYAGDSSSDEDEDEERRRASGGQQDVYAEYMRVVDECHAVPEQRPQSVELDGHASDSALSLAPPDMAPGDGRALSRAGSGNSVVPASIVVARGGAQHPSQSAALAYYESTRHRPPSELSFSDDADSQHGESDDSAGSAQSGELFYTPGRVWRRNNVARNMSRSNKAVASGWQSRSVTVPGRERGISPSPRAARTVVRPTTLMSTPGSHVPTAPSSTMRSSQRRTASERDSPAHFSTAEPAFLPRIDVNAPRVRYTTSQDGF